MAFEAEERLDDFRRQVVLATGRTLESVGSVAGEPSVQEVRAEDVEDLSEGGMFVLEEEGLTPERVLSDLATLRSGSLDFEQVANEWV